MVKLVLILTLMISVSTQSCPNMCRCQNYPTDNQQKNSLYYTSVYCGAFSANVTRFLSNTTRDLVFSGFNSEEVEDILSDIEKNITDFPFLVHLDLRKSEIGNLSYFGMSWVSFLSLRENNLQKVPIQFSNTSSIQTLDLSLNEINEIENDTFEMMGLLTMLNLSANSLQTLYENSFSGLKSLKSLDLSRNVLCIIRDQVLSPLISLQYLNLSNNHIEVLDDSSFSNLLLLQHLDISWNKLTRIAAGALHLPNLARLFLAGNPLLGRSREAGILVGTGRKLQIVDTSRTGLKQVPAALTHSIRTLRVAGNLISSVNCGDLDSYPLIQLLDFTSNKLEFIEEDALGRLDFLSVLYLSDNHIREIPRSLPEQLGVLHLEYNDIERVSDNDLLGLASLEVLLLNDNKIRVVDEDAFGHLISLVTLDLSRNPVTILPPGSLSGPAALQVLRLASIGIISPAKEVSFPLSSPEHLITLDLSDSPGLARQLLADTAALAASRELQELDLTHTDLEYIRFDLLHYLPQLRVLHIRDNRLNCSQLHWLASWMRRQDDAEYKDIICASPDDLWGTPLIDLQDPETTPMQTINQEIDFDSRETVNQHEESFSGKHQQTDSLAESTSQTSSSHQHDREIISTTTYTTIHSQTTTERTEIDSNVISDTEFFQKKTDSKLENKETANKDKYRIKKTKMINRENINLKSASNVNIWHTTSSWLDEVGDGTSSLPSSAELHLSTRNTINQAREVAITGLPTSLKQTVASNLSNLTSNETGKSEIIKLDNPSLISEISRNLFIDTEDERTFNNAKSEESQATEHEESSILEGLKDSSQWNISTSGEMSMFTKNKQSDSSFLLHPGMLILTIGVMGAAAALAMLAAKFTKKRRNSNICRQEDIEVNSLPSVTELW